jgi:hypothetical protein
VILPLLLAATVPQTALDAERAFARDARTLGQWTAFRKWAASDATMFAPQPIKAQAWLKDRKDPAKAIAWWPTASYVSCDGSLAVNTGGWKQPDGSVGYFTTVWAKQIGGGWKWIVDSGDQSTIAQSARAIPKIRSASCQGKALEVEPALSVDDAGSMALGQSHDRTLWWRWEAGPNGGRLFSAYLWNGKSFDPVIGKKIASR